VVEDKNRNENENKGDVKSRIKIKDERVKMAQESDTTQHNTTQ
jgi:hypothetical protein